ncbi:unnamed protein product [Trichobilharzia szidati]|nr:unnamed protein product [Trichobilharzia szidati]
MLAKFLTRIEEVTDRLHICVENPILVPYVQVWCRRFSNWFQVDEGISCLSDSVWLTLMSSSVLPVVETMLLSQISEGGHLC